MANARIVSDALRRELFADPTQSLYAIFDGASVPGLLDQLTTHEASYSCLFSGVRDPELAAVSPYLVRLEFDSALAQWVMENGWDQHWGIFATLDEAVPLRDVRSHLRTFLRVRDPNGDARLFRYYDPRVLRHYLPSCDAQELQSLFGPISSYMLEHEQPGHLLRFAMTQGKLTRQVSALAPAP